MNTSKHTGNDHSLSNNEQWVKDALDQHLNSKAENLDFTVTSKLAAARHRALDQSNSAKKNNWFMWSGTSLAAVSLVMAVFIGGKLYTPAVLPTSDSMTGAFMADLPLLTSNDDIEFYQSIEFLEWMESNSG